MPNMAEAVFRVEGITCADCAQKFEQAVNDLPGVARASLNIMTGMMTVEGEADLKAIQRLGSEEDYHVYPADQKFRPHDQTSGAGWEMHRALLSGTALAAGYGLAIFGYIPALVLPLYAAAAILGGWGNFRKAGRALPRANFNMSVLMSAAVVGAFAIGQYEEGASVAFLFAVSELLEGWTMQKARRSLNELMNIAPKTAIVRRGADEAEIPVSEVRVGDMMLIRPGEKVAMDGIIRIGESAVNQAAITGESIPLEKGPGDEVFAGTLNTHGALQVEVTKQVKDTTIARIIHMVEDAQSKRAPSQALIERFAAVYTPIVIALAATVMLFPPLLLGLEWTPWIYRGLALLVVACPCALVVSTPVAIVSAISVAAKNGVLIKGGIYMEELGTLKAIAFDKTGTLTTGEPTVTDLFPLGGISESRLLEAAACLEARSEHPLAAAIVKAAAREKLDVVPVNDFRALAGLGAQGTVNGELVYIGSQRLFSSLSDSLEPVSDYMEAMQKAGKTAILVGTAENIVGIVAVADTMRPDSAKTIAALKKAGIGHTIMLTGDNAATAKSMASAAGVDAFRAELMPQDKLAVIQELVETYDKVAMVGDGINDAPALALATVGIAMGGAGTDTALETAGVVLMADDLHMLPFSIRLSRKALAIIRQNIAFSLTIKLIAVLAVFPGWLTLWLAILADMGASILVTLNSLRLLREKPDY